MKKALRPLCLLLAFGSASCAGGDLITVAITPSATAAVNDGQTPTNIVATVMAGGASAADGTSVTFTITASTASFVPFQPATMPTQTNTVETMGGTATVQVYDIADETVTITISAAITPDDGNDYSIPGTAKITFGGKCKDSFIAATPTSTQSGVPASITLDCESDYMGGIFAFDEATVQLFSNNTQPCTATVNDASQQSVANAAVQFLTEAGTFETDVQATGQHPTELTLPTGFANVFYHVSAPYPLDVPWTQQDGMLLAGASGTATVKREWTGTDANDNPHTYNPRDGWVTMIAAVPGIPSNTIGPCNANADGGCPEPYVDQNDNNMWDLGEPYIDVNCNGSWDSQQTPNAQGLIDIWTSKTIVWTDGIWLQTMCGSQGCLGSGPLGDNPMGCSEAVHVNVNTCSYVFRWVDKNLNLLSTFLTSPNNNITYSLSGPGDLEEPAVEQLDVALLAKSLVPSPDISVPLISGADAANAPSLASFTLTATGQFVFGDDSIDANSTLVLTQQFGFSMTGSCDTNAD